MALDNVLLVTIAQKATIITLTCYNSPPLLAIVSYSTNLLWLLVRITMAWVTIYYNSYSCE